MAVQWAMTKGLKKHPDWYPGLDHTSDVAEVQAVVHKRDPKKCPTPCGAHSAKKPAGTSDQCHTTIQGEACWKAVQWAMTKGLKKHPDWYPGLDHPSDVAEV